MSELYIKKGGHRRHVSKRAYRRKYKRLGYEIIEDLTEQDDELEELTYDELQELAREEDLTGRSSMNKEELIEALGGDN